jgi:hypothetical protein
MHVTKRVHEGDTAMVVQLFQQHAMEFFAQQLHWLPCQGDHCLNGYGDYF